MRGGFTDKFQISQRCILDETIIDKIIERQPNGILQNVIAKSNHVLDVEIPGAVHRVRQAPAPFQYEVSAPCEALFP